MTGPGALPHNRLRLKSTSQAQVFTQVWKEGRACGLPGEGQSPGWGIRWQPGYHLGGSPDGPWKGWGLAGRTWGEHAQSEAPAPGADGRGGWRGPSMEVGGWGEGGVDSVISPSPDNALPRARGPCGRPGQLQEGSCSHPGRDLQPRGHRQMALQGPPWAQGRSRAGRGRARLCFFPSTNSPPAELSCQSPTGLGKGVLARAAWEAGSTCVSQLGGDAEGGNRPLAGAVSS